MRLFLNMMFMITFPFLIFGQGSLLLMGGGNDSGSWANEPFGWFVEKADSGIIIDIDTDAGPGYASQFISLGAGNLSETLIISTRSMANDSLIYAKLTAAKGIFIHGGSQQPYIDTWKGTLVEDAIHYVFNNGGAVGGTSAGLAVLGEVVNYGRYYVDPDEVAYNPYFYQLEFEDDFLNILPGVLTDSHFHERGRLGRLIPMMARRIQDFGDTNLMGIGVSTKTAFCIDENHIGITYGNASVTVVYPSSNSYISCSPNTPVTFTDINFDQLIPYSRYDIINRTLVDSGLYFNSLGTPALNPAYADTILNGSNNSVIDLGQYKITNLTSNELNAWYGNLNQTAGLGIVPNSIIIPKIYNDFTYDENRWVGGMWICVIYPHFTTIYLDNSCTANINAAGMLTSNKLTYILDTYSATFVGVNGTRSTNHCGIIGAKLYFLGPGDQYDLLNHNSPLSAINEDQQKPNIFRLEQNYPNPFNPSTNIRFFLTKLDQVKIEIYNLIGQRIKVLMDETMAAGYHEIEFFAQNIPSGVYLYKIQSGSYTEIKKMILLH